MKCAYKQAMDEKLLGDVCEKVGTEFLAYVESMTENTMHEVFGFGAKRLEKMRDETAVILNELMQLYSADNESIWSTTQTTYYGVKDRLDGLGFDLKKAREEWKVVDHFGETWHNKRDISRHEWRKQWIDNTDIKMTVYWGTLLLYLHDEYGYGKVRLKRYYDAARKKYNQFCELYLLCKDSCDAKMVKMIEQEQKLLEERGVEFRIV